jgi:DNA modification methylase
MILLNLLKPDPNNPRIIKDHKFDQLCKSLQEFPQMMKLRPLIVDKRNIIRGGNMRYKVLEHLGYKEIPDDWVKWAEDLTDEQIREFIIKDNLGYGEWDWDALANDWDQAQLVDWGLDIPDFALPPDEVTEDDYEVPAIDNIKTDIVSGDLFEIGPHRLLCGDSTSVDSLDKLMAGKKADMLVTDPPYGVSYVGKTKKALTIENDALDKGDTHKLWRESFGATLTVLKDGGAIYATVAPGPLHIGFANVLMEADCLRQIMVWNKGQMVLGHSDYHYQHEPILYGWKPGAKHYFINDRTKTTVFDFKKPARNEAHPTMKPVELWGELITNSSKSGEIVYDSFLGSGTTMVASHQIGRVCYGMELDPKYCQVIVDRMLALDPTIEIKRNGVPYSTI